MNLNKTEALEIITAANPQFIANVDDAVLDVTKNSLLSASLVLINSHKPLNKRGSLILKGKETRYSAPGDAHEIIGSDYGIAHLSNFMPSDRSYPKGIPSLYIACDDQGKHIRLSNEVPTNTQGFVGTLLGYDYKALYKIDGDSIADSNVPHTLQTVLEAASHVEVARRQITAGMFKTVGDGHKNKSVTTPQDAYDKLLDSFKNLTTGMG